ncbi:MAG: restriction endonuclease subunit S, partial [Akkermansiaceae bacterium]|nr:restriction endonuclease subunit S [Akkermansiaceae bacterium]
MKVKLGDVCDKGSSNLMQKEIVNKRGQYPIYGASGQIGSVDFFHQNFSYVAVVKDGAGIGRTMLLPAKSSVIGTMQYLLPKSNVLPDYLYYVVHY